MNWLAIPVTAVTLAGPLAADAAPPPDHQSCQQEVDRAERLFQLCASEGVVVGADGGPGSYGVGCTMDHVLAFASAYAGVVHCAMQYHHAPSLRELRDFRDMAEKMSSPASERRLEAQK